MARDGLTVAPQPGPAARPRRPAPPVTWSPRYGIGLPRLNGRRYGGGLNWMKAGGVGTILPLTEKMLNLGPSAAACLFRLGGMRAEPVQLPVFSLCIRTRAAVIVFAWVHAQRPAVSTKTCRTNDMPHALRLTPGSA